MDAILFIERENVNSYWSAVIICSDKVNVFHERMKVMLHGVETAKVLT